MAGDDSADDAVPLEPDYTSHTQPKEALVTRCLSMAVILLVCGMTWAQDSKVFTQPIAYEVAGEKMEGFLAYPLGDGNGAAVVVVTAISAQIIVNKV